jgi:hypothetical protein
VAGRARAGDERPLVLIDPALEQGGLGMTGPDPADDRVGVLGNGAVTSVDSVGPEPCHLLPAGEAPGELVGGRPRLVRLSGGSLEELAAELDAAAPDDFDVVLAVPVGGVAVLAEPDELIDAAQLFGGVCVAASPVALGSPVVAQRIERAVTKAAGFAVERCYPYPYGLVGAAGPLRLLLADSVAGGSDADGITNAVLSGRHDVIIDTVSEFFHVLDGTGTDVVVVAGRARAGDERPLVLIDPALEQGGLGMTGPDPADGKGPRRAKRSTPDQAPGDRIPQAKRTFGQSWRAAVASRLPG